MKPERIQRRRSKGWRLPENTACVTRPSKWGNPFRIRCVGGLYFVSKFPDDAWRHERDAAAVAVTLFREHLRGSTAPEWRWMREHLADLRGKNLACWCPLPKPGEPDFCHAAALLEAANR